MTKLLKLIKIVPEQYNESKISFWAYIIFNILTFATLIYSLVIGEYINCFYCLLAFFFLCLPPAFERVHNAYLPPLFEVVIMIFIFSFAILGESFSFMTRIPWWDTMLHTFYGFVFAALGFSLIEILNDDSELKFKLSPGYICLSTIGITTLFGVLWEFFEFFADHLLGKDMQKDFIVKSFQSTFLDPSDSMHPFAVSNIKSTIINYADGQTLTINGYLDIGITDTIKDLAVAFIGSFVFCIFLLAYLKTNGNNKVAKLLVPVKREGKATHEFKNFLVRNKSFFAYIISAGISYLIDISLFALFLKLFSKTSFPISAAFIATVCARVISSLINYYINKKKVFEYDENKGNTLLKYYALAIPQMLISAFAITYVTKFFAIKTTATLLTSVIKFIIDVIIFIVNYIIQRVWVFKKKD